MTITLRNNVLIHWAIPVERTISVHACDKICLSEDYSPLPIEAHAVITHVENHFNRQNPRAGRAEKHFPTSVKGTSASITNTLDSSHHKSFLFVIEVPSESSPKG